MPPPVARLPITAGVGVPAGTYRCDGCVYTLQINSRRVLDRCPNCDGQTYRRTRHD